MGLSKPKFLLLKDSAEDELWNIYCVSQSKYLTRICLQTRSIQNNICRSHWHWKTQLLFRNSNFPNSLESKLLETRAQSHGRFKTHVFTFAFWDIRINCCCLVCRHLVRLFALALRKYPKLQPCTSHSRHFHVFSLFSESKLVGQGLNHSHTHFVTRYL